VETAIPARDNQRTQSRAFVKRLDEATRIFAEQTYAEHLIRDVSEHKATTVAELLGFMRQYQLLFSDPGDSPEVESLYEGLYGLLRQQLDLLGGPRPPAAVGAEPSPAADPLRAGSVWTGTLSFDDEADGEVPKKAQTKKGTSKKAAAKKAAGSAYKLIVKDRNGARFTGEAIYGAGASRKVEGNVNGARIKYQESDGGGKGFAIEGTIENNVIVFKFEGRGPRGRMRSGEGRLTTD
jgi:hypothetical protein